MDLRSDSVNSVGSFTTGQLDLSQDNMLQQSTSRNSLSVINATSSSSYVSKSVLDNRERKIKFSSDTVFYGETGYTLALSVPYNEHVKALSCTLYTITVICQSQLWSIRRRYRDFEELHKQLVNEIVKGYGEGCDFKKASSTNEAMTILPTLPKKRWFFQKLSRNDVAFNKQRRLGLEKYLRALLRMSSMKMYSHAFHKFLNEDPNIKPFTKSDRLYDETLIALRQNGSFSSPQLRNSVLDMDAIAQALKDEEMENIDGFGKGIIQSAKAERSTLDEMDRFCEDGTVTDDEESFKVDSVFKMSTPER